MFKLLITVLFLNLAFGHPVNDDILDKATFNDIDANSISSEKRPSEVVITKEEIHPAVEVIASTTERNSEDRPKPQQPGTGFARLIDDIFNIPITVLQSVARLLRNPFTAPRKTPETILAY